MIEGPKLGARPPVFAAHLDESERLVLQQLVSFALDPQRGLAPLDPLVLQRARDVLQGAKASEPRPPAPSRPLGMNDQVAARVRELLGDGHAPADQTELFRSLSVLAHWRAMLLANTYVAQEGAVVFGGLFKGMRYLERSSQGMLLPRLLGTYEAELHPHFEAFLREGLEAVVDVGCAEGYYAVGLARVAPEITVHAHDIDQNARELCAELAQRNDVADRVIIGGEFKPADFEAFAGRRVLVLVDAEGAEVDVLDPALAPALADMPIIVETHDVFRPGAEALMRERFAATHEIIRVLPQPKTFAMPAWMEEMADLDLLLASWDYRGKPTPWLVMRPRQA